MFWTPVKAQPQSVEHLLRFILLYSLRIKRSSVILLVWTLNLSRADYPDKRPSLPAAVIEMGLISAQKRDAASVLIYDPDMRGAAAVSLKADRPGVSLRLQAPVTQQKLFLFFENCQ